MRKPASLSRLPSQADCDLKHAAACSAALQADPEDLPGMVVLMESYINRMETTIAQWYNNIITADLAVGTARADAAMPICEGKQFTHIC